MRTEKNILRRWGILAVGVFTMLFAGIIYAWSILKIPFAEEIGYEASALALNFTLTMCFFCLGGLLSSRLIKLVGTRASIVIAGLLAGVGFVLSGLVGAKGIALLYVTYALMAGLGIGIAYIVIISAVNAWFPDRRGLSSGALMMGFGGSSLILGNLADKMFQSSLGWKNTYVIIGIALGVVLVLSATVIDRPRENDVLPSPKVGKGTRREDFEAKDYKPSEMIGRFTFWRAFVFLICISAVGNSVISFARDLALSTGASAALATTLVGVLAVCNGLGRMITGAVFDALGRRFTMTAASILTVGAAAITLIAVNLGSLPLCIVGLCLVGMSYGTSPTVSSAFTMSFYGPKHFASNLGIMNFNLMCASFIATACTSILKSTGGYTMPFVLLLSLSVVALSLNFTIKKP